MTMSPDLVTISSNTAADEYADTMSLRSEYLGVVTPATPRAFPLSIPSPIPSRNDISPVGTDLLQSMYPHGSIDSLDHMLAIRETEWWPINPQMDVPQPFEYGQLQECQPVHGISTVGYLSKTASGPSYTDGTPLEGAAPMPAPPEQPISTEPLSHDNSSGTGFSSVDGQPIPSYMSPEAIRARNLILRCNLPSQRKKIKPAHTRDPTRHVQFPEDSQSSKRQKLDGSCCPYSRVNGVRPR